jgi:hypothetical protein
MVLDCLGPDKGNESMYLVQDINSILRYGGTWLQVELSTKHWPINPAQQFQRVHDNASDCLADHFDFDDQIEIGCYCIDRA